MLKPLAEVHAGRLSVLLQALTFSVTDVLKDLDPLVDENISTSKHTSSKWAEQSLAHCTGLQPACPQLSIHCFTTARFKRKSKKDNSLYLAESCLHPNAAEYGIVKVFPACKSNMKTNKIVNAHLNHCKWLVFRHSYRCKGPKQCLFSL